MFKKFFKDPEGIDKSCEIQMLGNAQVYVEGFKSVVEYDENLIVIKSKKLKITFLGNGLDLKLINDDGAIVVGEIREIMFLTIV